MLDRQCSNGFYSNIHNIHKRKIKIIELNTMSSNRITLDGEALKVVETFTYLVSNIDKQGGSDANVNVRIDKSKTTFL